MTVLDKLASALGRRDEVPNQELAATVARTNDPAAVRELVAGLWHESKAVQSDCVKVLYEIGAREPALIAGYCADFGRLLESNNNRLVWGAMTALDAIAAVAPAKVHALLDSILAAADTGSVITRDHAVGILVKLAGQKRYAAECLPLLVKQLSTCPANQFPMYAEMSLPVAAGAARSLIERVLTRRLSSLPKESQKNRVRKVLKRLAKDRG